ncbi:MAG: TIGR01457 family HAD-type hydrolase [Anaerolineae bacterium]|jgi:4-nitrophenyl phosphatase
MTVQEFLRTLQSLIIDMDGVLYRGSEAIPGTRQFLSFLREQDIDFILATNNSTKTPDQFVEKLASMDVVVHPDQVLTSAMATAAYLRQVAPQGTRVFVVGQEGLQQALRQAEFELVEDGAEYVVAGMDFGICYERLAEATLQIRAGAQFVGTNPDRTFPSERGIVPGAGSLLAFLQAATGVTPTVIGKPQKAMMEQALATMGAQRDTTAVLGDRLETDILAGNHAELHTILVLSGITNRDMLVEADIQPDHVFEDVAHLHAAWKEASSV